MMTNTTSITATIKAAFAKGEKSVLVGTQYGDVLITKKTHSVKYVKGLEGTKGTTYRAELIEKGMNCTITASDPLTAMFKIGPYVRAAYYRDYSNQYFG